jgi:hypothetical protein
MSEDRTKRGIRDLVLSMAVVGIFVAFLFVVVWRPAPEPVKVVDPTLQLEAARAQAAYDVLAPVGLSGDWKSTSARFEANEDGSTTWFLGYVTPDGRYVALARPTVRRLSSSRLRRWKVPPTGSEISTAGCGGSMFPATSGHWSAPRTGPPPS